MGGAPERNKNSKKIGEVTFGGGFLSMLYSLKYSGMIYIKCMCVIPMNVHNELINGDRQLRGQHVLFTCSYNIFYIYQAFILRFHKALHPPSRFLSPSFCPPASLFFCGTPSRYLTSGISLRFRDGDVFFLPIQSYLQLDTFTIQ